MDHADKIKFILSLIFRSLLVIAATLALFKLDPINLALSLTALLLTFLPTIIAKKFKLDYPSEFEIMVLIFVYASIYLGEIHSFYLRFWWWDVFLHALSGVIIGIIGFSLVYILNRQKKLSMRLTPFFVALFSFSFAMAIGGLWEVFEFGMDSFFGFNMQKSGLVDTMWDLILDAMGALAVSIFGGLYLKGNFRFFERMEKKFIEKNIGFFRKRPFHK
ncbi:MAG: hypothetical protein ABIB71_01905 [Candidatus Woesearchaeota archaeon]